MIIHPSPELAGRVRVPGDKSVTHRALMLGAIAVGTTEIVNPGLGEDNLSTFKALAQLGVEATHDDATHMTVRGVGLDGLLTPEGPIDCGNSGTTMRLLAGLLSGAGVSAELVGDESLARRPMRRVVAPLKDLGYAIEAKGDNDTLPVVTGRRDKEAAPDARAVLKIASAQVKSCLLLSGLYRDGVTEVVEPAVSRDHTERMLRAMGVRCESAPHYTDPVGHQDDEDAPYVRLYPNGVLRGRRLEVPGDLSSAAFLLSAGLLTGHGVTVEGVGTNPSRIGILHAFERMGASVRYGNRTVLTTGEPAADLTATPGPLRAIRIAGADVPLLIDEIPVLAVLGAASVGRFEVRDARELRVKESDRIATTLTILEKMGVEVEEFEDGFAFDGLGSASWSGFEVDAAGDHRIALAAAVAGLAASSPVTIHGASAVAVSYPGFADVLAALNGEVTV